MSKLNVILFAGVLLGCLLVQTWASDEENDDCDCIIPDVIEPVCASNDQSYPNRDSVRCKNECEKTNLLVKHEGFCENDPLHRDESDGAEDDDYEDYANDEGSGDNDADDSGDDNDSDADYNNSSSE